jgi:hypothetical protein
VILKVEGGMASRQEITMTIQIREAARVWTDASPLQLLALFYGVGLLASLFLVVLGVEGGFF